MISCHLITRISYPYAGSVDRETCCLVRITSSGCNAVLEISADSEPIAGDPIKVINHSSQSIIRLDSKDQHKVRNTNCAQFVGEGAYVNSVTSCTYQGQHSVDGWVVEWRRPSCPGAGCNTD